MAEYIDREAVIDLVGNEGYYGEYDLGCGKHNDEFKELVRKIPAADVRPVVRGHWTNVRVSITGNSSADCSRCGVTVHDSFSNRINFCPNCGADMRGGDAE